MESLRQSIRNFCTLEEAGAALIFEKCLTNSDVNGLGRLIVPKAQAHKMPDLDDGDGLQVKCRDGLGNHHTFRWRFWINNSSRMYLLESLQGFYEAYNLKPGHTIAFGVTPRGEYLICPKPDQTPRFCSSRRATGFIKRKESSVHGARRKSMTGPTRAPVKSGLTKIGHVDKDVPAAATMVEDTNLNEEFSMHFFASRTDRASTLPSGWEIDRTFRKTQLDVVKSMPKVSVSQECWSTIVEELDGNGNCKAVYQAFFPSETEAINPEFFHPMIEELFKAYSSYSIDLL